MTLAKFVGLLFFPSAVVVAALYIGTGTLMPAAEPKADPPATVVVWGDGSFTNRRGFKMWLEAHGGNYRRWAKNHRAAAAVLSGRRPARRPAAAPRAEAAGADHRAGSVGRSVLLALGAGVIGLLSLALVRRLPSLSIPTISLTAYGTATVRLLTTSAARVQRIPVRRSPPVGGSAVMGRLRSFAPLPLLAAQRARRLKPMPRPSIEPLTRAGVRLAQIAARLARVGRRAARAVVPDVDETERLEIVFWAIGLGLAVAVGIFVPLVLAP
jgi:hypothetical protein